MKALMYNLTHSGLLCRIFIEKKIKKKKRQHDPFQLLDLGNHYTIFSLATWLM